MIFCKILWLEGEMAAGEENENWVKKRKKTDKGKGGKKKKVKIVIMLSKNASREVQKSKIFLPRGKGHPSL